MGKKEGGKKGRERMKGGGEGKEGRGKKEGGRSDCRQG